MSAFSAIFGQDTAVDSLRQAYRADRLPHAMIFAGRVGVGKATTARALGKLFLCEKPKDDSPCGKCESCRVFDAGNHPDFHIITKELIRYYDKTGKSKGIDLSVNVIRPELIDRAAHKAVMNRGKVFIVEQAELMSSGAQNALLKTLEEPAGRTIIILLTDQPDLMLPTTRSRCRTIRFAALDPAVVARELVRRGIDKTVAARAAELSGGSPGLALKWIEDDVIATAEELIEQFAGLFSGRIPPDLPAWFKKAAEGYAAKQLERDELGSKDQATREGLGLYLYLAGEQVRRKMADFADVEDAPGLDRACAVVEALARAEQYLDANVNIPLVFQQLAVTLESVVVG